MKPRVITVDGDRVAYRAAGKGPVVLRSWRPFRCR
jgi:hypothetical protein